LGGAGNLLLSECGKLQLPLMYESLSWRKRRTFGAQETGKDVPKKDREKETTDRGRDDYNYNERRLANTAAWRIPRKMTHGGVGGGGKVQVDNLNEWEVKRPFTALNTDGQGTGGGEEEELTCVRFIVSEQAGRSL